MKKLLLALLVLLVSTTLVACDDDPGINKGGDNVTVSFNVDGGSAIGSISIQDGSTVTLPTEPTKEGYLFDGWYLESTLTTSFDSSDPITEDITLYAKWTEDPDDEPVYEGPGLIDVPSELPSTNITIDFWVGLSNTGITELEDIVDEFESIYSTITVNLSNHGAPGELHNDLEMSIIGGAMPTVFAAPLDDLLFVQAMTGFRAMESLIPLDDFIYSAGYGIDLSAIVPAFLEENQQYDDDGYFYSFPFTRTTEIAVYNVDELGPFIPFPSDGVYSWDQLETWSASTTCEYMVAFDNPNRLFLNSAIMWDAPFSNVAGELLVDNDTTRAMLTEMKRLFDSKVLTIPQAFNASYSSEAFLDGDVCMSVIGLGGYRYHIPTDDMNIAFAGLPQYDTDNPMVPSIGTNLAISGEATPEQQLAAWLLIRYLSSPEAQASLALAINYVPVNYESYASGEYADLLAISDPNDEDYYRSRAHNAAYQMLEFYQYHPSFYGSFTSKNLYDNADLPIMALMAGYTVQEALQGYLDEIATYE